MSGLPYLKQLPDVREDVARVAERWKQQYQQPDGSWSEGRGDPRGEVYRRLAALTPEATAQDVADIIGNDSWIGHRCDGCGSHSAGAWQIGEEPDYENSTVILCDGCMGEVTKTYLAIKKVLKMKERA